MVRDVGPEPIPGPVPGLDPPQLPPGRTWTTVEFTDLRFDYPFIGTRSAAARAPLGGWVYLVDGRDTGAPADRSSSAGWEDAGEAMNGREQR